MNGLSERAWVALAHMGAADEFVLDAGREWFAVLVNGYGHEVYWSDLAEFERRGWVVVSEDRIDLTDAGRYWRLKWLAKTKQAIKGGR